MDFNKFTQKSQEVLNEAQLLASQYGNQPIENGHLLKGIFIADKEVIPYLLGKLSVNQKAIESAVDAIIAGYPKVSGGNPYLSPSAQKVLNSAVTEMKNFGDEFVSVEVLFY